MQFKFIKSIVVHPVLFAIFPVFLIISTNINEVIFTDATASLLMVIAITVTSWFFLNLFLKNKMKSSLLISFGLILFFSYGHVTSIASQTSIDVSSLPFSHSTYLIPLYLLILILGIIFLIRIKKNLTDFTTITNIIAIILIVMLLPNVILYTFESKNSETPDIPLNYNIASVPELKDRPNIYYIILDEYAGNDVLKKIYNYDNSDFLSELHKRGFYVPSNSHSNYVTSPTSIISSLNMEYINNIPFNPTMDGTNKLFNNNQIMRILKSLNYTVVNLSLEYGYPEIADYDLCKSSLYVNSFHTLLSETTLWNPFSKLFVDGGDPQRDNIKCKFSELSNLHKSFDSPFFVFAHLLLPHPPYLFGPNGESVTLEFLSIGAGSWKDKSGYVNQVQFTNKKVLETIDHILQESDTLPIIILQGDHGTPTLLGGGGLSWKNINDDSIRERMSIFNAYYFPNSDSESLYDTITPVNSFRIVLNNYLNGNYELLEDKMYFSPYTAQLNFTDVTTIVSNTLK